MAHQRGNAVDNNGITSVNMLPPNRNAHALEHPEGTRISSSLLSLPQQATAAPRRKSEQLAKQHRSRRDSVMLKRWHTVQGASADGGGYSLNMDMPLLMDMEESVDYTISSKDEDDIVRNGGVKNEAAAAQAESGTQKPKRRTTGQDESIRRFRLYNEHCSTEAKVKSDGRLRITVNETTNTGYLGEVLGTTSERIIPPEGVGPKHLLPIPSTLQPPPHMNIVIMVIGSRGDIQPFLKIGKLLKDRYRYRIRVATHPAFKNLVQCSGLEFFSVGGDPSELMAFMVKNPGMIPSLQTVRAGEISKRRDAMADMFEGFWRSCIHATDDETDKANTKFMGDKEPFVADCIIANPPSYAHIHCAEALGIPMHLVFTFPYTPTQAFPHPLASVEKSNVDLGYANLISYPLFDMMVWQGLGDLINTFRVKTLSLDPLWALWAPGATYRLRVPFTYLWSPGLVPKPHDWGEEIDVTGYVFLETADTFEPDPSLMTFLEAGERPIYIGFGSIVVDDAKKFTDMIFEAIGKAGVRALVSRGWSGFGRDDVPDTVFMLGNVPHDWLFPRVSACVIHGGAGTTASALKLGRPTMIVPFFGDQHFWGSMVGSSGAGPKPVPYRELTSDIFADGIKYLLTDEAKEAAGKIARSIEMDGNGAENAIRSFQKHLKMFGPFSLRCSLLRDQVSVWGVKDSRIRLGPMAADILVDRGELSWKKLRLLRHQEWNDFAGPVDPVSGIAGSLMDTLKDSFGGIGSVPVYLCRTAIQGIKGKISRGRRSKKERNGAEPTVKPVTLKQPPIDIPRPEEYVTDVTRGVGKTASAIVKAPASLALAIAQGFHNAPRLYGDDTVRRPTRITGFHSGLVASRREFVYGIYDGIAGVVLLPARGARADGFWGFLKGTAFAIAGLVLKPISAVVGPVGYTMQGTLKQTERWRRHPHKVIRRARITQGYREIQCLRPDELSRVRARVLEGWHVMKQLEREVVSAERGRGIAGHIDHIALDTSMMFADVEIARWCLRQLRKGASVEDVLNATCKNKGSAKL
jgi:UDP:flavonoid glycosyltransferase YjiC (YdhE family)